jgi:DNA-binding MarR family transcriptional regulator
MRNLSATSVASYKELVESGQLTPKQRVVYGAIVVHGNLTREQIAAITQMKEGSVCGRIAELMEKGLVVAAGLRQNPITKKVNEVIGLPIPQMELAL